MFITCKRFLAWGLLACLPLVVAGCGGGGGGGPAATTIISGIATVQGPVTGAVVEIFQLKPNGSPGELLGSGTSGTDGRFAIAIPVAKAAPPLVIKVSGQTGASYSSAATPTPVTFTAAESFFAAVDKLAAGQIIAVSPLSDAGYKKLQQVLTQALTGNRLLLADVKTVGAVNTYVALIFNVTDLLADPTVGTNIANQAALTVIDQMIAASGSNTVAVTTMLAQAVADVASPEYQRFLIALQAAGTTVLARTPPISPALATAIQALLANALTPPANPDFTDVTAPTAPTNLTARVSTLNTSSASAILSWTASTDNNGVAGYEIYRDGSIFATVKTPGYTDSSLIPGSTYTYFVIAFDAAGNRSAASSSVNVTPLPVNLNVTVNGQVSSGITSLPAVNDLTPPTAPTNLAATTAAVSATTSSVTLSWSPATDNIGIAGYDLFRDNSKIVTVTTTGYLDAAVSSGVTHTYFLIAFDAAGNRSPASNTVSVTPPASNLNITVNGQISSNIIGF